MVDTSRHVLLAHLFKLALFYIYRSILLYVCHILQVCIFWDKPCHIYLGFAKDIYLKWGLALSNGETA